MKDPSETAREIARIAPKKYKHLLNWMAKDFASRPASRERICGLRLAEVLADMINGRFDEQWKIEALSIMTNQRREEIETILARAGRLE